MEKLENISISSIEADNTFMTVDEEEISNINTQIREVAREPEVSKPE